MFQQKQMDTIREAFPAGSITRSISGFILIVLSAIVLYYLYRFLYGMDTLESKVILGIAEPAGATAAAVVAGGQSNFQERGLQEISPITEGGEYSVTAWLYLKGFKDAQGKNKHVLEIRGTDFSTLLIAIGSTTNKLLVRVGTQEGGGENSLSLRKVRDLFKEIPSGLTEDANPVCDLPEIDLQRWIHVGVVLNGRTVDVYLDGKLARSCVLPTFYRVDSKGGSRGVRMKLFDMGGFDGEASDVTTYSYALNPDQMYRIYMAGPSDITLSGFLGWLTSFFNVKGQLSYRYPQVGVQYSTGSLSF